MKKLLVASDLSDRSRLAVDRAARLARSAGAALEILHVLDDHLPGRVADEVRQAVGALLLEDADDLERRFGVRPDIHLETGDPWRRVVEVAASSGADLLVIGAHRNRGIRELFQGTTVNRVALATRVPLLLVISPADADYRQAVVGVDFSASSVRAANLAAALAAAPPILVHGYHIAFKNLLLRPDPGGETPTAERDRIESRLRREFETFRQHLSPAAALGEVTLIEDAPLSAMFGQVRDRNADLLCLGSHGRRYVEDFVLGSTASEALSYPPCDVLLAPPEPEA